MRIFFAHLPTCPQPLSCVLSLAGDFVSYILVILIDHCYWPLIIYEFVLSPGFFVCSLQPGTWMRHDQSMHWFFVVASQLTNGPQIRSGTSLAEPSPRDWRLKLSSSVERLLLFVRRLSLGQASCFTPSSLADYPHLDLGFWVAYFSPLQCVIMTSLTPSTVFNPLAAVLSSVPYRKQWVLLTQSSHSQIEQDCMACLPFLHAICSDSILLGCLFSLCASGVTSTTFFFLSSLFPWK